MSCGTHLPAGRVPSPDNDIVTVVEGPGLVLPPAGRREVSHWFSRPEIPVPQLPSLGTYEGLSFDVEVSPTDPRQHGIVRLADSRGSRGSGKSRGSKGVTCTRRRRRLTARRPECAFDLMDCSGGLECVRDGGRCGVRGGGVRERDDCCGGTVRGERDATLGTRGAVGSRDIARRPRFSFDFGVHVTAWLGAP